MVNMPPGSAKSTYGSHLFPAWMLGRQPNLNILGASHTTDLAEKFSRKVQNYVRGNAETLDYGLKTESVESWETTNGGSYKSSGVGTGIAGFRAACGIIDDPVKNREAADSLVQRDKAWDWYKSDFIPRLVPGASQVVIMTRWHEDDLGGRLLETEPEEWHVVTLPAIAGENDPLGRAPGEMLWSDDEYGYGAKLRDDLAFYERVGGMRDWSALYQQQPAPLEGSLFKIAKIDTLEVAPAGSNIVRAWDLAATKETGTRDPDWTVGVKLLRASDSRFIVLDVTRLRGGPDEVEAAIVNTAKQDGHGVRISLPQDPGQAGKQQVLYLTRKLSGFRVDSSPETGDKATRASPVSSQVNVGNLCVVRGQWNRAFLDELAAFPSGTKDDQVDALSRAFSVVGLNSGPIIISDKNRAWAKQARR
jgi:predicted phage terminase large subunit-like protein